MEFQEGQDLKEFLEMTDLLEKWDHPVFPDQPACRGHKAQQAKEEHPDKMETMVAREAVDRLVTLDPQEKWDHTDLQAQSERLEKEDQWERLAKPDTRAHLVYLDPLVRTVKKESRVNLDPKDEMDALDRLESVASQESRDHQEFLESPEKLDQRDLQEELEKGELRDLQERKESLDLQEDWDHKVCEERVDPQEKWVNQVTQDHRVLTVLLDVLASLDHPESLERLDHRDLPLPKEKLETQDMMARKVHVEHLEKGVQQVWGVLMG